MITQHGLLAQYTCSRLGEDGTLESCLRKQRHGRGANMRGRRRRFEWDTDAGIEGLPLQLLIMVVVAGLGLTIIMGWMNSIEAPHSIGDIVVTPGEITVQDTDGDGIFTASGLQLTVTVTDQSGDRLEGATVMLQGANVMTSKGEVVRGVTNSKGQVAFSDIKVEQFGSSLTTITVTVAKGDYGIDASYEIPVIPS